MVRRGFLQVVGRFGLVHLLGPLLEFADVLLEILGVLLIFHLQLAPVPAASADVLRVELDVAGLGIGLGVLGVLALRALASSSTFFVPSRMCFCASAICSARSSAAATAWSRLSNCETWSLSTAGAQFAARFFAAGGGALHVAILHLRDGGVHLPGRGAEVVDDFLGVLVGVGGVRGDLAFQLARFAGELVLLALQVLRAFVAIGELIGAGARVGIGRSELRRAGRALVSGFRRVGRLRAGFVFAWLVRPASSPGLFSPLACFSSPASAHPAWLLRALLHRSLASSASWLRRASLRRFLLTGFCSSGFSSSGFLFPGFCSSGFRLSASPASWLLPTTAVRASAGPALCRAGPWLLRA